MGFKITKGGANLLSKELAKQRRIKNSCKNKRLLRILINQTNNTILKEYYKKYDKCLKKIINTSKKQEYIKKVAKSDNKIKAVWQIVKERTNKVKNRQLENIELNHNNITISDSQLVANKFNDYFIHVGGYNHRCKIFSLREEDWQYNYKIEAKIEMQMAINILREFESEMSLMVEGNHVAQVSKLLQERAIQFYNTTDPSKINLSVPIARLTKSPTRIPSPAAKYLGKEKLLDWKDYHPLQVIYSFLDKLEAEFPALCTVEILGQSVEGRDIKMLKISNSDSSNASVWMDSITHAREWITVSAVTYIANYIVRNFSKLPTSMTNKDWYVVPIVNPDGYVYTHRIDRLWRKSRARYNNVAVGVDLNRNFGVENGSFASDSQMDDPNHVNFRGPCPFSEPETLCIKDYILYSVQPFKIFLTFHSYSEVISFPWCSKSEPCQNYITLLEGATIMAKAIYETTGKTYKVGCFRDIMYYATGTSIDWSHGIANIPFSYLLELRSKQHKFLLPKEEIKDCCKETLAAILSLMSFVDKYDVNNRNLIIKKTVNENNKKQT